MEYSLVVRNGTIIDGTGATPYVGDVGVRGGVSSRWAGWTGWVNSR